MTQIDTMRLIIAERGASRDRIRELSAISGPIRLVEQGPEEPFRTFADRVQLEAGALADRGVLVTRVNLLAAGRAPNDTVSLRSLLVRGLASSMAKRAGGFIRLESAGGPGRFHLRSLALTMDEMLRGTGVAVRHLDPPATVPSTAPPITPASLSDSVARPRPAAGDAPAQAGVPATRRTPPPTPAQAA